MCGLCFQRFLAFWDYQTSLLLDARIWRVCKCHLYMYIHTLTPYMHIHTITISPELCKPVIWSKQKPVSFEQWKPLLFCVVVFAELSRDNTFIRNICRHVIQLTQSPVKHREGFCSWLYQCNFCSRQKTSLWSHTRQMYFFWAKDIRDLSELVLLSGIYIPVSGPVWVEGVCVYTHNGSYSSSPKCNIWLWTWPHYV